jgi:hypothetical protein
MISAMTRPRPSPIGIARARSNFDGLTALEHVEGGELAGLLDAQPGLQQQLQQRPVPERFDLAGTRRRVVRACANCALGVLPVAQCQRPDRRHGPLEVEHGGLLAADLPAPRLVEPDADEVATLQRHRRRRQPGERRAGLSRPHADVREEAADVDKPLVRGQPIPLDKVRLAALHLPGAADRVWDERQQVLAPNVARAAHLGVILIEESPQVLERVVLVARGGIHVADPLRVGLQVELVHRSEALRDTGAGDQFGRRQPPAPQPPLGALLGCAV